MNERPLPSQADWGETRGDLDLNFAFKQFGGRTYQDALSLFETTDVSSCAESLGVMPDVPFRYYMLAFKDFIASPRVFEVNDGLNAFAAASCFLSLVEQRLKENPASIKPILPEVLPVAQYVSEQQSKFDADEDIFGRFSDAIQRIRSLASAA